MPAQFLRPAVEAEDFGERRLDPEAERGLVDGDEAAGVEAGEEEGVPAREHALDGGGVIGVAPPRGAQAPEVEEGGGAEKGEEARPHPCRVLRATAHEAPETPEPW